MWPRRWSGPLEGTRSYKRFRTAIARTGDDINPAWVRFRDARREALAIQWLIDSDICDHAEAGLQARLDAADRSLAEVSGLRR